jgi:Transmembrane family 220, helix
MPQSSRLLRGANWVMLAAFLFSVAVQYNDPDPIRWMLIYGLAALNCFLSLRGRLRWPFPAAVGTVALVWAATIAPGVIGRTTFREMFQSFHMTDSVVEEARETGGLLIVAFWMAVLSATLLFRSRQPGSTRRRL